MYGSLVENKRAPPARLEPVLDTLAVTTNGDNMLSRIDATTENEGAALSGAVETENNSLGDDLREIIRLWPSLSEFVKADVLMICREG